MRSEPHEKKKILRRNSWQMSPILILKALAKVVHLSLDSLMSPDLTPDEAGQNEMKLLYMNCPPEMRETLLSHTRGFAEELKEISKKLEKE